MANSKYDLNNIEKISNVILSIQFLFLLIYEYKISFFVFWTLFWFKSRFLFICQKCFIVLRLLMTIFDISHFLYIVFCLFVRGFLLVILIVCSYLIFELWKADLNFVHAGGAWCMWSVSWLDHLVEGFHVGLITWLEKMLSISCLDIRVLKAQQKKAECLNIKNVTSHLIMMFSTWYLCLQSRPSIILYRNKVSCLLLGEEGQLANYGEWDREIWWGVKSVLKQTSIRAFCF